MARKNTNNSGRQSANSTAACPRSKGLRSGSELVGDGIDDPIEEMADLAASAAAGGPADDEQRDDCRAEHDECVLRGGLASISVVQEAGVQPGDESAHGGPRFCRKSSVAVTCAATTGLRGARGRWPATRTTAACTAPVGWRDGQATLLPRHRSPVAVAVAPPTTAVRARVPAGGRSGRPPTAS